MKKLITGLLLVFMIAGMSLTSRSQVLISLLLGDKLNSGKIEFGLDGGVNWLTMSNTPNAKYLFDWNLGFYFDFKMKNPHLFIHTGVLNQKWEPKALHLTRWETIHWMQYLQAEQLTGK
jgi:hypothetical protein